MSNYYTVEKHIQILIALLKFHGIKKVIASPGVRNVCFVGSIQNDPFFEIYSSVDERSAAYIACGLAAESGEPVALTCTGSTASRNYASGLTEAYYRKLPVLAITATRHLGKVGNSVEQVIDRSVQMKDMVCKSIQLEEVHTRRQEKAAALEINKALIALRRNGGGPVHINLVANFNSDFSVRELPKVKGIRYTDSLSNMPAIDGYRKIAILAGTSRSYDDRLTQAIDKFCEQYGAVVLSDPTSGYKGSHGVNHAVFSSFSSDFLPDDLKADLVISIGSFVLFPTGMDPENCQMWRIQPYGEISDNEGMLSHVFEIEECLFFEYYTGIDAGKANAECSDYYNIFHNAYVNAIDIAKELPYSNIWCASNLLPLISKDSKYHVLDSDTVSSWLYFDTDKSVRCCFHNSFLSKEGQSAALIGASKAVPERTHFAICSGDMLPHLSFIANEQLDSNIRLIVINDAKSDGTAEKFAADNGCEYIVAKDKDEFLSTADHFVDPDVSGKSMVFEIMIDKELDKEALIELHNQMEDALKTSVI